MSLIFVMVDGLGLAPAGPHNPVATGMPHLRRLLGLRFDHALRIAQPELVAHPIDASLGVAGLPQSGSGHTALYGGYNAPERNGRHQPSHPTIAMRARLSERNLFSVARAAGHSVAWANAYLPGYSEAVDRRRLRHTAGTWSALAAGLALRGLDELRSAAAVSWDLTQELARERPGCADLPIIASFSAGERLARLALDHDLVAFETYLPDLAGHRRIDWSVDHALELVDDLLAGIVTAKRGVDTLLMTSDHGNAEDSATRVHTRNPVPLWAAGPAARHFSRVTAIDGVMDAVIEGLAHA